MHEAAKAAARFEEMRMKFNDAMLPDWVGVLGSALIVALITAAAMPAASDELGRAGTAQTSVASSDAPPSGAGSDDSKP
jgi:hypothetical protein